MEIYLAHTQGFCAGVARAIEIVDRVLEKYGSPIYVFHEIVHNKSVVSNFMQKGVCFVDSLDQVPDGVRLVFSAHGVSPAIVERAHEKKLKIIDATCPLVGRIHRRALELSSEGIDVVLIGHKTHQEIIGTQGYVDPALLHIVENQRDAERLTLDPAKQVGFVTQTTLSLDDTQEIVDVLKARFPRLIIPSSNDICYATQTRQDAIKELCKKCDLIIVCGSPNSSNSQRLKETAQKYGIPSILIDKADELGIDALDGVASLGISSGASVPGYIVDDVVEKIKARFVVINIHASESPERKIKFSLPKI